MSFLANCPLPLELPCIENQDCAFQFGQIQRLAFLLKSADAPFATSADVVKEASWTAALSATGKDKLVLSNFISNFIIPQGEILTDGGGSNETLNGVERLKGVAPVKVTGHLSNSQPAITAVLRDYTSFSAPVTGLTNLEVLMINEKGSVIGRVMPDGTVRGIPILNFTVGTVGSEGFGAENKTPISFSFLGSWDEGIDMFHPNKATPPWNPLSLANVCI